MLEFPNPFNRRRKPPPPVHGRTFDTFDALHAYQEAAERSIEPMSLPDYRRICRRLPVPTHDQITTFIREFSRAGSWYKHFPFFLPGAPITFFVSPTSGCHVRFHPHGLATVETITRENDTHRRMSRPTETYRLQFGHLQYAGHQIMYVSHGAELPDFCRVPKIAWRSRFRKRVTAGRIPPEVAAAGRVELTGAIHPLAPLGISKLIRSDQWPPASRAGLWPLETGGEFLVRRLEALLNRPQEELQSAIEPERRRQREEIGRAINRVLALIYD